MKIMYLLLSATFMLFSSSCVRPKNKATPTQAVEQRKIAKPVGYEVKDFSWGGASIRPGMTKAETVNEITRAFKMCGEEKMIIRQPKNLGSNSWKLPYGHHGGTAPGCAVLKLSFKDNKLVTISIGPHCK